jgi:Spy/CpxP family protein refolding chaperone
MKAAVFACLVTVISMATAGRVLADTPAKPGAFEDAGRLIDQLAGRLGTVGAELAQQLQGRGGPSSAEEAGRLVDLLTSRLGSIGAELAQQLQGRSSPGPGGSRPAGRPAAAVPDRPLITIMLHHRTELGLSPEQVGQLETLRGDFTREMIRRDADIRIAELDLTTLLEREPVDFSKVEAKVREVAQLRGDLRLARLRAIEQGKAVLTPDQRARLQTMLGSGMHHGSGGGPGGGPSHPPAARPAPGTGARL